MPGIGGTDSFYFLIPLQLLEAHPKQFKLARRLLAPPYSNCINVDLLWAYVSHWWNVYEQPTASQASKSHDTIRPIRHIVHVFIYFKLFFFSPPFPSKDHTVKAFYTKKTKHGNRACLCVCLFSECIGWLIQSLRLDQSLTRKNTTIKLCYSLPVLKVNINIR